MRSARSSVQVDLAFIADDARPNGATPQADSPTGQGPANGNGLGRKALPIVFFALLAAHLAFNVDPRVLYQADEATPGMAIPTFPAYFRGTEFLKPLLAVPGGLTEYVAANLSQYFAEVNVSQNFSFQYGGAVILVAVALVAFLLTDKIVQLMGGRAGSAARFIPPLLLMVIWNRYTFVLADQLVLLTVLLAMYLYLRLPDDTVFRVPVGSAMIIASYYIAGGPGLLLAVMCALHELLGKRRAIGLIYLPIGGLTPLIMGPRLTSDLPYAYSRLLGLSGGQLATTACVLLYVFFILLTIGAAHRDDLARTVQRVTERIKDRLGRFATGRLASLGPPVAMLAIAAAVAMGTLDRNARMFRRICYYSQTETWGGVILEAREFRSRNKPGWYAASTCRRANRALFEEKILAVEMFAYPQVRMTSLLPGVALELEQELYEPHKSDTLLQLGAVGAAEQLALESHAMWGDRPFLLRLLAKIYIVKGDMDGARHYLLKLKNDIVHGKSAEDLLAKIDSDYDFEDDEEIARIRSFMIFGPPDLGRGAVQRTLERLVDRNRRNRMAVEYLLAHYLLTGQLDEFALRVDYIQDFGYARMPPHYAEALRLRAVLTGQILLTDALLTEDADTIMRGERFVAVESRYRGDLSGLAGALTMEMPRTYYAYYFSYLLQEQQFAQQNADR